MTTRRAKIVTATMNTTGVTAGIIVEGALVTVILNSTAITGTNLTVDTSPTRTGTFVGLYDSDGNRTQIASPSTSTAYNLPAEAGAVAYMRLSARNSTGTLVAQSTARTITVVMKD